LEFFGLVDTDRESNRRTQEYRIVIERHRLTDRINEGTARVTGLKGILMTVAVREGQRLGCVPFDELEEWSECRHPLRCLLETRIDASH